MKPPATGTTAPGDKVSRWQKLCYGAGATAGQVILPINTQMIGPVFNITLGLSPAWVGFALMVFRLWDALTDVVMGNISDNARTRWGRRRPFLIVGAVLSGCLMPLFWSVPRHWSHEAIFGYMVVAGTLFYTAYSIWAMPYYSMGMEMTPDYAERTRVMAYRAVFEKASAIGGGWLLALASLPYFMRSADDKPNLAHGMWAVSFGLGALVILFGILPGLFVKERYYRAEASAQPKVGLGSSLRMTFRCKPFMVLMPVYFLHVMGTQVVGALGLYLNIYYVNGGDLHRAAIIQGWKLSLMSGVGILALPFWSWLAARIGKRHALAGTIVLGYCANILFYFCYTPVHPYLQILPSIFLSSFGSAVWMLVPSMQADIADYDELGGGERREGSFAAISSCFFKVAMMVAAGGSGLVLTLTGFNVLKYGHVQPPVVLHRMLDCYVFLPMLFWTAALALLAYYPLTQTRVADIRRQLESRRGKI